MKTIITVESSIELRPRHTPSRGWRQLLSPLLLLLTALLPVGAQTPATLSRMERDGSGVTHLEARGGSPTLYALQASPDLNTWRTISTNAYVGDPLALTDTGAKLVPRQFYRLVSVPGMVPPSRVTATQSAFGEVTIRWQDNSSDETDFVVQRCFADTGELDDTFEDGVDKDVTSYLDTDVPAGRYFYRISAYNWLEEQESSAADSNVLLVDGLRPPAPPSHVMATAVGFGLVQITWTNNASEAEGFFIGRFLADTGEEDVWADVPADARAYLDEDVPGGRYFYVVTAYTLDGDLESAEVRSNEIEVDGEEPPTTPAAPSQVAAALTGFGQVRITWSDNATNESGYYLLRYFADTDDEDLDFWLAWENDLPPNSRSYVDNDVVDGRYYYEVWAFNDKGEESAVSPPMLVAPASLSPGPLGFSQTSAGHVRINCGDPISNETGFEIQRSTDGVNFAFLTNAPANASTAFVSHDTSAVPGRSYHYRVRALKGALRSGFCAAATYAVPFAVPGPLSLTVSTDGYVRVQWTDNTTFETGFEIQYSLDSVNYLLLTNVPANADAAARVYHTTANECSTYTYRVRAVKDSARSAWSVPATTTTPPLRPGPLSLYVTSFGSVRVQWADNSACETGFLIQRSTDGINYSTLTNAPANPDAAARIFDAAVTNNRRYYYRVAAYNGPRYSDYSAPANIVVP